MTMEDELLEAIPAAPQPRKFSRLRKGGAEQKATPQEAPIDENAAPNGGQAQPSLPTPAGSPTGSRLPAADEAQPSTAAEQEASEGARETAAEGGGSYWDEEDELEDYFGKGKAHEDEEGAAGAATDNDEEQRGSGSCAHSDGEEGSMDWGADVNADTQRVLRETASRDRLGKEGAEVEVKPLSSILDKIKQRQQAAIERAPKPKLLNVPSFEEVFAAAQRSKAPAPAAACAAPSSDAEPKAAGEPAVAAACGDVCREEAGAPCPPAAEGEEPGPGQQEQQEGEGAGGGQAKPSHAPQVQPAEGGGQQSPVPAADPAAAGSDEDEDLEIVDEGSDQEEEANIVELPSTTKKKRPAFTQFEMSFEDEVLIDDGYNSEDQLEREAAAGPETSSSSSDSDDDASEGEESGSDSEDESAEPSQAADKEGGGIAAAVVAAEAAEAAERAGDAEMVDAEPAAEPSGDAGKPAAERRRQPKMKRLFLDMEAELSDEEGEGMRPSDDEEDDDLDDQGELADLIGTTKETGKDLRKRDELHRQWAEQQDAKDLQQVLKGLKQGFRRRHRDGFLDDEDDEAGGRQRRARLEEEEEEGAGMDDGVPRWFRDAAGSDEDADDLELLKRAQEQHALGESQQDIAQPASLPLDEESQEVLSLLARSASEPQALAPQLLPRSRFAPAGPMPVLGSEPSGGASRLGRGVSFLGRQPSATRVQSGGLAGLGAKSFVFGREDSNSGMPAEKGQPGSSSEAAPAGPTSFANLRQLTGMPAGPGASSSRGAKAAGASLVSRLAAPKQGRGSLAAGSQASGGGASAADIVYEQVVTGMVLGSKK